MKIRPAKLNEAKKINQIYLACKIDLDSKGIFQWTDLYPNPKTTDLDIQNECLFKLENENKLLGIITFNEFQDKEYQAINWTYKSGKALVIHRLAVDPIYQRQGHAKRLMDFTENYAIKNGYASIRLDAFSKNKRVLQFYENRDYKNRGFVYFPYRDFPFFCFEKCLYTSHKIKKRFLK